MLHTAQEKLINAIEFTDIYKSETDPYLREAKCVDFQCKSVIVPLTKEDTIAGMVQHNYVGFSSQYGGIYTYFFHQTQFENAVNSNGSKLNEFERNTLRTIERFWVYNNTVKKANERFITKFGFELPLSMYSAGAVNADFRVAGTNVDYHKLMDLGLPGLKEEINEKIKTKGNSTFYQALIIWIDTVIDICRIYEEQALALAEENNDKKCHFTKLAKALKNIQISKPQSFLEGIQLMWIYSIFSDIMNYARMDDYLGDLFVHDIDNGICTEEEAIGYVLGLYKHFKTVNKMHDCRVITGGKGRRNEKNADRLALVIYEASRRFKDIVPQLTLRYYKGMSEEVFDKAMQLIGEGCTFPLIYSDDTNIPAVMEVYKVPYDEALQYTPFGCGEYVIIGKSTGTPNNGINTLKALEVVLHEGKDQYHNEIIDTLDSIDTYDTFEKLYSALIAHLKKQTYYAAYKKYLNYKVAGEESAYLHLSLLMDDCVEKNEPLLSGGVKYLNAASEVFGIISCADSLTAIKKYVYEEKKFTLRELVHILDCDFQGYEKEQLLLKNAPKYGNDNDYADSMATRIFSDVADMTIEHGKAVGLNAYAIVSVNNSMSAEWGYYCEASACGRNKHSCMANANGASIGADKNGITSLLNSMSKFDNTKHAGVINNIRFSKELFYSSYDKIKMTLKAFYENNGVQTNITVIGKDDLENAMKNPENYQNLIVRIGGFSARFVNLDPTVQREILSRTTYA